MENLFARFTRDEEGQDLTEYALLVAFIAFVVYLGVQAFGTALLGWYNQIAAFVTGMPIA